MLLAAATVCGPAAPTIAANDRARVFTRGRAVYACHARMPRPRRVAAAGALLETRLAGDFALLRLEGERLEVHDLRRGYVEGDAGGDLRFTRIRFHRGGTAAYVARRPDGELEVGATGLGYAINGHDIAPRTIGLDGFLLAYGRAGGIELAELIDGRPARARTLVRRGSVAIGVRNWWFLYARSRGRRPIFLGESEDGCLSSSGCSGINRLQFAGDVVAARFGSVASRGASASGSLSVADTARGRVRTACEGEAVGAYVVTPAAAVACAVSRSGEVQILSEGTVLDRGPGVDPGSLRRRGDVMVWRHDGAERSAPLPRRG